MKKLVFIIITVFAFIANSHAQNCNYYLDNSPKYLNCGDSIQLSSSYYSIVKKTISSCFNVYDIWFTDSLTGYATTNAANSNNIVKTTDGGNTWTSIYYFFQRPWSCIEFLDSNIGFVGTEDGALYKTKNGGISFSIKHPVFSASVVQTFFTDTTNGYLLPGVGASSSYIMKTTNGGDTWTNLTTGYYSWFSSIFFTDSTTGYVVGGSLLLKTTNAGASWVRDTLPTGWHLRYICFTDSLHGYAVGDTATQGLIVRTTDGGITWTSQKFPTLDTLYKVAFPSKNVGFAMGLHGFMLRTEDAGNSWQQLTTGITSNLFCAYFIDENTGFFGGNSMGNGIYKYCNNYADFSWQPTQDLNSTNVHNPIASPLSTNTYKVTITPYSYMNCPAWTDSVTVNVIPLSVTATTGNIFCKDSTQLTTATSFNNSNYTYSWLPVAGLSDTASSSPKASPALSTIYTVTVNPNNGCGTAQDTAKLSIDALTSPEICLVSVRNFKNLVIWEKPLSVAIDSFYIYRETDVTNIYEKVGTVAFADSSMFVDTTSFPLIQSNKYKLAVKDLCNIESVKSSIPHKTMHLTINQGTGTTWNLIWEPYEGFTVNSYKIYRGTSVNNLSLIGSTSGTSTQYTDYTAPAGMIYYQVQVISPNICNPSKGYNKSFSNIASNDPFTGIEQATIISNIRLFPNPATNTLFINGLEISAKAEVYDISGKLLLSKQLNENQIDISSLAKGLYFIKLSTAEGSLVRKFVKE
jgi:photosystem II stability/assembly factor-like uncharacterized protein